MATAKVKLEHKGVARNLATPKSQQEKLQSQIQNYQTRLASAGVNPEAATDTRNWFERLTNLPEDQNFIFDLFELINRPQQAFFTGINNAIQGEDFLEGLKEGFTGEETTSGGEILRNLGMEGSGEFNLFDPSSYGEFSLSDVLGLGLDLFADPIDPVLGKAMKGIGKGAKTLANKGDNLITKGLTKLDDVNKARIAARIAETGETTEQAAKALNVSIDKLDTYKGIKNQLSKLKDSSKNLMGLVGKGREAENIAEVEKRLGKELLNNIDVDASKIADNFADLGFKSKDEALDAIQTNLVHAIENKRDWTLTGKNVIDRLVENKSIYMHSKRNADDVIKALKEFGIKAEAEGAKVKLLSSKNKLYAIQDAFGDKLFGSKISETAQKTMDDATAFFNQNKELKDVLNKAQNATKDYADIVDVLSGTNLKNVATDDYIKHVINENVSPSEAKAFNARKYDAPIAEVNEMKRLEKLEEANKLSETNEKIKKSIYKTDNEGNIILDKSGNPIRDTEYINKVEENYRKNIEGIKSNIASQEELMKAAYIKDDAGNIVKKDIDLSKVDPLKLNKKDLKVYNQMIQDKELSEVTENLKKIKYEDIAPTNSKAISTLRESYSDYTKWVTSYKNELMKKAPNEKKLEFIKAFVDSSKKEVTANIKAVEALSNKQSRQIIKQANKAYKEGKSIGAEIEKATAKLKISQKKTQTVFDSLVDNVDALNGKLNFQQENLKNLLKDKKGLSDEIFNKKLRAIEDNAKAISTLSDEATQEFFKTTFDETFIEYVNRGADHTRGANKLNEALTVGIFDNPDVIKKVSDLPNNKIPYGFEEINPTYLKNKMLDFENMLSDDAKKTLKNVIDNLGDEPICMDKDLANYLKVSTKSISKEVNPLLKMWDGMNNVFKKFSTLTGGFQMRNIVGNSTNMVLSGVSAKELPSYYKEATKIWNNADDLLKKAASKTLNEAETKQWETLQEFYKAGFLNAFEKGQGLEAVKNSKGLIGKASKASIAANEWVDTHNRLALLMYAKDHPEYVSKLGRSDAVDAVKMVLFDPTNMTDLEKSALKRIIPFYTFTKQNLMFQAENIMKNTPRYNKLFKSLNKAYNAVGEDNYYQYQKEAMQIPLPWKDDDGNQMFLKTNLPISDLGEFLSDPLGRTVASMTPIFKAPVELKTGKSLYTGDDTNYKTLSNLAAKSLNKLGVRSQSIENAAQAAETILSNFGLQNVSTNLIKKITAIIDRNNDDISNQQLWAEILRSVLQNTKQENVINSGLYDQLEQYQSIVKRLKSQGVDVPTMTQINQVNKMKLNKFKNKRAKSR